MSLVEFKSILRLIGIGELTPDERREVFKEAALMTLARATSVDANIKKIEVEVVQTSLATITDEEIPQVDIRLAADSEIFERRPLEKYLSSVGRLLSSVERMKLLRSLAQVLKCDDQITDSETAYFDMVAHALHASPSEVAGLVEGSV